MGRLSVLGAYVFYVLLACVLFLAALGYLTAVMVQGIVAFDRDLNRRGPWL